MLFGEFESRLNIKPDHGQPAWNRTIFVQASSRGTKPSELPVPFKEAENNKWTFAIFLAPSRCQSETDWGAQRRKGAPLCF